jgi:predicted negative regulator of RcsB-dependent stress response
MLDNISGEQIKEQFKSNNKLRLITMIVGGVVVVVLGYFAYRQFLWQPDNEKSKDSYWIGLNHAAADSTELAIEELEGQVKKFDGKVGGEVAQFVLARQYMSKGEFETALKELESVDVDDAYVSVMAIGLQGDCYSELKGEKNYGKAYDLYLKAAEKSDNEFTTPMYLMKAGLVAEELKNFDKATECYQNIKDNYSSYASQKAIDKFIARAKNKTTK